MSRPPGQSSGVLSASKKRMLLTSIGTSRGKTAGKCIVSVVIMKEKGEENGIEADSISLSAGLEAMDARRTNTKRCLILSVGFVEYVVVAKQ